MRKFFLLLGAASVLFVGFAVGVIARHESPQPFVRPVREVAIPDGAADRLAASLRIQTISSEDPSRSMRARSRRCTSIYRQRFRECMRS